MMRAEERASSLVVVVFVVVVVVEMGKEARMTTLFSLGYSDSSVSNLN